MKRKKRNITLIEIMIVILLIGLISGALAFNMRGSVQEGRIFKTNQNRARIHDILMLEHAREGGPLSDIKDNWEDVIAKSNLVTNGGKDIILDGWKEKFDVALEGDDFVISSAHDKK